MTNQDEAKTARRGEAEAILLEEASDAIRHMLDSVAKSHFGRSLRDPGCVCCGSMKVKPSDFRDELSAREYKISKLCQECQDKIFGEDGQLVEEEDEPEEEIAHEPVWTDPNTGLMWQVDCCSNQMTWDEAVKYCQELSYGGFTDWRLPTVKELFGIVDTDKVCPALNTEVFPYCRSSSYWSSTTGAINQFGAWGVNFYYGYVSNYYKSYRFYVRAVRKIK